MFFIRRVIAFIERILAVGSAPLFLSMGQGRLPGVVQGPGGYYYFMGIAKLRAEMQILGLSLDPAIEMLFVKSISEIDSQPSEARWLLQSLAQVPPTNTSFCIANNLAVALLLVGEVDSACQWIENAMSLFNMLPLNNYMRGIETLLDDNRVKIEAQGGCIKPT